MEVKYSVIFICQSGDIEIKSILLALSLKDHVGPEVELIAAIPRPGDQTYYPSIKAKSLLNALNVKTIEFENPYLKNKKVETGDLFTNKSFCLNISCQGKYIIFLDSDILCLNKFSLSEELLEPDFLAKQVDFANVRNWEILYKHFRLKIPDEEFICSVDKKTSPPYFNSGVFIIKQDKAKNLGDTWFQIFQEITTCNLMTDNYLRRHQASLALAVQKLCLSYSMLDVELNFPVRSKKTRNAERIIFAHYHDAETAVVVDPIRKHIDQKLLQYPQLSGIINQNKIWRRLFNSRFKFYFRIYTRLKYRILNIIKIVMVPLP